jgi:hypothetical protein
MSGTTTFVSIAAVVQMRKKNQEGAFLGGLLEVCEPSSCDSRC